MSPDGRVLRFLLDPDGSHINSTTAVTETERGLFIGNLAGNYVSFLAAEHLPPLNSGA